MKTVIRTMTTGSCCKEALLTQVPCLDTPLAGAAHADQATICHLSLTRTRSRQWASSCSFAVHTSMVPNITTVGYMEFNVVWMATSCVFCESWCHFIFIRDTFLWSLQIFIREAVNSKVSIDSTQVSYATSSNLCADTNKYCSPNVV